MIMLDRTNQFRALWSKGYKRLLPVVPHTDPMRAAGKRPGEKLASGKWIGGDSKAYEADEAKIEQWWAMGAGVGLRCDRDIVGLDIDVLDATWSERIQEMARAHLGPGVVRVGRAPKALLMFRPDGRFNYRCASFDQGDYEKQGLVELLAGEAKWFVAEGVHPDTQKPYYWPDGVPDLQDVPLVTHNQMDAFFEKLASVVPRARQAGSGDRSEVDQEALKATDLDLLIRALRRLPNETEEYDKWVVVAAAIKAATADEPDVGLEAFIEWSGKLEKNRGREDPERVFNSLRPPYSVGADYIYEETDKATGSHFASLKWIEPLSSENLSKSLSNKSAKPDDSVFEFLTMAQIRAMAPPQFLVGRHIPEQSVGVLYGEPGCGKSFLALDMALHLAYGRESWHGDELADQDGLVLYIAGEGSHGFQHRVDAWLKQKGVAEDSDNFRLLPTAVKFLDETAGAKLVRSLRSHVLSTDKPVTMIVVDTVSRSLPGADENAQKEMTLFIEACTNIQNEFKCAVMGIHHPNKEGGMRGSTTLAGACDYVFKLERKKGHPVGSMFCEKQKDAPDGWTDRYRFDVVSLGDKDSSLVPSRMNVVGEDVVPVGLEQAILRALQAAWGRGEPWAKSAQAKDRWAVKRMVSDFAMDAHDAGLKLNEWLDRGTIVEGLVSRKDKKKGLRLVDFSEADTSDGAGDTAQHGAFE